MWWQHKDDLQINGAEPPEMNPDSYCQLIFDKSAEKMQWGKE